MKDLCPYSSVQKYCTLLDHLQFWFSSFFVSQNKNCCLLDLVLVWLLTYETIIIPSWILDTTTANRFLFCRRYNLISTKEWNSFEISTQFTSFIIKYPNILFLNLIAWLPYVPITILSKMNEIVGNLRDRDAIDPFTS